MKDLKIAFDSGALMSDHAVRGIGMMVGEQISALKSLVNSGFGKVRFEAFDFSTNYELLTDNHYDVVHYPYFFPFNNSLPDTKFHGFMVVTIQDLIQLVYPKIYPPGISGRFNFYRQKSRLNSADAIITISETSKKDIVRFLGVPESKVSVIYLAPKKEFKVIRDKGRLRRITEKYNLPGKFVLYVGDVNYNKNVETLVRACLKVKIPLVICGIQAKEVGQGGEDLRVIRGPRDYLRFLFGKTHPELGHIRSLSKLFTNSSIKKLGFIPDEDLVGIYNLATVYCQPSLYEGFGLPVLEAFACETPVVVSKTQALVEVAGGAALIADPNSWDDFADKILTLIKDSSKRLHMIRLGSARVKDFSWDKVAREMMDVYKKVAGVK